MVAVQSSKGAAKRRRGSLGGGRREEREGELQNWRRDARSRSSTVHELRANFHSSFERSTPSFLTRIAHIGRSSLNVTRRGTLWVLPHLRRSSSQFQPFLPLPPLRPPNSHLPSLPPIEWNLLFTPLPSLARPLALPPELRLPLVVQVPAGMLRAPSMLSLRFPPSPPFTLYHQGIQFTSL